MKICMLTTGFPRFEGDLFGSFVFELAKKLTELGTQVLVVAPHQRGLPKREVMDGIEVRRFSYMLPLAWQRVAYGGGIPTNIRRSWLARLQVPLFLLAFWWAARRASRSCQLIHCHWTYSGLVAHWASRRRRPLVLSVRGSDIHLLENRLLRWLNRWIYQRMDRIVGVSSDIAAKLIDAGVEESKVQVVYNGVDSRFRPGDKEATRRQLGLSAEAFIVLFIGLLVPVKGIDVLLEALGAIKDEALQAVLVGDGPLKEEIEQEIATQRLAPRVFLVGRQPTLDIPLWLNAADVLVLPSRSEGRPNVVLEAQACGVPVIATRVGGTPELIKHGETGLLIDSEDAGALAEHLVHLMRDATYRQQLALQGQRAIADSELTWEASARRMLALYDETLEAA